MPRSAGDNISDFQITSRVRSVLARHWVDLQKITFGTFRGTVRFTGELCYLGERGSSRIDHDQMDLLESEIRTITGVRHVYFELLNWHRTAFGEWTMKAGAPVAASVQAEETKTLVMKVTSPAAGTAVKKDKDRDEHQRLY